MDIMFLAATSGTVPGATPTALMNPMTGLPAAIPAGSCITNVFMYRDGNQPVTDNCRIQLGDVNNTARYITIGDNFTTTLLNTAQTLNKHVSLGTGTASDLELRVTFDNDMDTGSIYFRISCTSIF
jgi:hypothetical protein